MAFKKKLLIFYPLCETKMRVKGIAGDALRVKDT